MRVRKGFTMVELLIAVAMIGIISVAALTAYQEYNIRSKATRLTASAGPAQKKILEHSLKNGNADSLNYDFGISDEVVQSVKIENGIIVVEGVPAAFNGFLFKVFMKLDPNVEGKFLCEIVTDGDINVNFDGCSQVTTPTESVTCPANQIKRFERCLDCPSNTEPQDIGGTKICVCPTGTFWNNAKEQCLVACSPGEERDFNGDCVTATRDLSAQALSCGTGQTYDASRGECVEKSCSYPQILSGGECVCPNPSAGIGPDCSCTPNTHFVSNGVCISKCGEENEQLVDDGSDYKCVYVPDNAILDAANFDFTCSANYGKRPISRQCAECFATNLQMALNMTAVGTLGLTTQQELELQEQNPCQCVANAIWNGTTCECDTVNGFRKVGDACVCAGDTNFNSEYSVSSAPNTSTLFGRASYPRNVDFSNTSRQVADGVTFSDRTVCRCNDRGDGFNYFWSNADSCDECNRTSASEDDGRYWIYNEGLCTEPDNSLDCTTDYANAFAPQESMWNSTMSSSPVGCYSSTLGRPVKVCRDLTGRVEGSTTSTTSHYWKDGDKVVLDSGSSERPTCETCEGYRVFNQATGNCECPLGQTGAVNVSTLCDCDNSDTSFRINGNERECTCYNNLEKDLAGNCVCPANSNFLNPISSYSGLNSLAAPGGNINSPYEHTHKVPWEVIETSLPESSPQRSGPENQYKNPDKGGCYCGSSASIDYSWGRASGGVNLGCIACGPGTSGPSGNNYTGFYYSNSVSGNCRCPVNSTYQALNASIPSYSYHPIFKSSPVGNYACVCTQNAAAVGATKSFVPGARAVPTWEYLPNREWQQALGKSLTSAQPYSPFCLECPNGKIYNGATDFTSLNAGSSLADLQNLACSCDTSIVGQEQGLFPNSSGVEICTVCSTLLDGNGQARYFYDPRTGKCKHFGVAYCGMGGNSTTSGCLMSVAHGQRQEVVVPDHTAKFTLKAWGAGGNSGQAYTEASSGSYSLMNLYYSYSYSQGGGGGYAELSHINPIPDSSIRASYYLVVGRASTNVRPAASFIYDGVVDFGHSGIGGTGSWNGASVQNGGGDGGEASFAHIVIPSTGYNQIQLIAGGGGGGGGVVYPHGAVPRIYSPSGGGSGGQGGLVSGGVRYGAGSGGFGGTNHPWASGGGGSNTVGGNSPYQTAGTTFNLNMTATPKGNGASGFNIPEAWLTSNWAGGGAGGRGFHGGGAGFRGAGGGGGGSYSVTTHIPENIDEAGILPPRYPRNYNDIHLRKLGLLWHYGYGGIGSIGTSNYSAGLIILVVECQYGVWTPPVASAGANKGGVCPPPA